MIDINEVLRRAAEAGKMPPKPEIKVRFKAGETKPDFGMVDLRRRPDGVWEMPE